MRLKVKPLQEKKRVASLMLKPRKVKKFHQQRKKL